MWEKNVSYLTRQGGSSFVTSHLTKYTKVPFGHHVSNWLSPDYSHSQKNMLLGAFDLISRLVLWPFLAPPPICLSRFPLWYSKCRSIVGRPDFYDFYLVKSTFPIFSASRYKIFNPKGCCKPLAQRNNFCKKR